MSDKKQFVENQMDERFSGEERLDYSFDTKDMGQKDRAIVRALSDYGIADKACLDIGPGTGRWLTFLKQSGANWLAGVDISDTALERVKTLCNETQKADVEKDRFNFDDDTFEIVISIEVLEHLRDPSNYISEIIRVAKDGALVLMSLPNIASLASRVRLLVGMMPVAIAADPTHVKFYRKKDIARLFSSYGQSVQFLPTSISLNPLNAKSKFKVPSFGAISSFDDSLVFCFKVAKK